MGYALGLPAALARRGLRVETVPGWETRSAGTFNPRGAVCHWTAGPRIGDRPSLHVVTYGRSDLAGPLCNVFLSRAGVAVVVAAGRANHAGEGSWRGLVGNSSVFGTEAENSGCGEWTAAQRCAYPRICAAYLDLIGTRDVAWICGHNEWAPTRKIDIRDWPMPAMRTQVAAVLAGAATPSEDELSAAEVKQINDHIDAVTAKQFASLSHGTLPDGKSRNGAGIDQVLQALTALNVTIAAEGTSPDELKAALGAQATALAPQIAAAIRAELGGSADTAAIEAAVESGVRKVLTEGTGGMA